MKFKTSMKRFKRHRDYGFFDQDIRLSKLSTLGDPLERLNNHVDFEMFRTLPQDTLTKEAKGKGGRHLNNYVMMFKVLILQRFTIYLMIKLNIKSMTE